MGHKQPDLGGVKPEIYIVIDRHNRPCEVETDYALAENIARQWNSHDPENQPHTVWGAVYHHQQAGRGRNIEPDGPRRPGKTRKNA